MKIEDFNGRVAVITGGAAGIGRALAQELKTLGASVAIVDLPGDTLDATADELGVDALACDVSDAAAVDALAQAVVDRYGKVDLLFNNAGVGLQQSLYRINPNDWNWVFDVNFRGVVHGIRSFLPHLSTNPEGAYVVNTASLFSLYTGPGMAAYAASKYAVLAVTETLAKEVSVTGDRIGVTAFCPGPIDTTIYGSLGRRDPRYGAAPPASDPGDPVRKALAPITGAQRMPALEAARIAIAAVKAGRFWAITHPEYTDAVEPEHAALRAEIDRQRTRL